MQGTLEDLGLTKMESLQLFLEKDTSKNMQKMDSSAASFGQFLESKRAKVQETVQNEEKLEKMKADLREAEDEFVKVLGVKTRKEAKQMVTRDSISATKAKVEELKRNVEVQRARKDEYASIVSQQSLALANSEEKTKQDRRKGEIEEAISWYYRVLGFYVEGGHGVKFTFSNINMKNPKEEYSFTVRHADDAYTLLDCDPPLNDIKELIQELNRSNGLFKFVKIMKEKFQEAAVLGLRSQSTILHQESSTISVSATAPVSSVSTQRSESPAKINELQTQNREVNKQINKLYQRSKSPAKVNELQGQDEVDRQSKKVNYGTGDKPVLMSPGSASSLRRSSRVKTKK